MEPPISLDEKLRLLALELAGTYPSPSLRGAKKREIYVWVCKSDHQWRATLESRLNLGTGCPYCSGRVAIPGVNDLATTHGHLAVEFNRERNLPLTPESIKAGSGKKVWWLCSKGHEWLATVSNRSRKGYGCPICKGRLAEAGVNDLSVLRPALAEEFDVERNSPLLVSQLKVGSTAIVWWECKLGHSYRASVQNRAIRGSDCPFCSGNKALRGFNDLESQEPELLLSWHFKRNVDVSPDSLTSRSNNRVWWVCKLGHEWLTSPKNRVRGGCPVCSGKAIWPGFNDLPTVNPELLSEWDFQKNLSVLPEQVGRASNMQIWWICEFMHSWKTKTGIRVRGSGCPTCNTGGFDPNSPAVLYFLSHTQFPAYKMGIMNLGTKRLEILGSHGWKPVHQVEGIFGAEIRDLEADLFSWVRGELDLPYFFSKEEMAKTGGYTETFPSESLSESEVISKIEELRTLRRVAT